MTKGTFWLSEKPDGGISIHIEDYGVECFGGMDCEMIYTLDPENLTLFTEKLSESHTGTFAQMLEEEFGISLDRQSISKWMDSRGIRYGSFFWTS